MSKSNGGRAAILSILLGGLGVGGFAYYVQATPKASRVPAEVRVEKPAKKEEEAKPVQAPRSSRRRRASSSKVEDPPTVRLPAFGDDISDMELSKIETAVPPRQTAMKFVAQRIVDAAQFDNARVTDVEVRDHVAIIRYSEAVAKGMGSMEEGAFLRALQLGFGQFEDVDRIQIESGGKPLESGHVDLTEPLAVIRPGQTVPEDEDSKPVEP